MILVQTFVVTLSSSSFAPGSHVLENNIFISYNISYLAVNFFVKLPDYNTIPSWSLFITALDNTIPLTKRN